MERTHKCLVDFLNAYNINTSKTFGAITSVSELYEVKVKRKKEKRVRLGEGGITTQGQKDTVLC